MLPTVKCCIKNFVHIFKGNNFTYQYFVITIASFPRETKNYQNEEHFFMNKPKNIMNKPKILSFLSLRMCAKSMNQLIIECIYSIVLILLGDKSNLKCRNSENLIFNNINLFINMFPYS